MYRSTSDEPPADHLELMQHGPLTLSRMIALMEPGAIDPAMVQGRRVRWSYSTTRRANIETKNASDELKRLHLQMGAAEVMVHRGPWLKEDGE